MVIELNEQERFSLMEAANSGFLDTWDIQRVADEIRESEPILEVMAELEDEEQQMLEIWAEIEEQENNCEPQQCKPQNNL